MLSCFKIIASVYWNTKTFHLANQVDRSGNTLFKKRTDSHKTITSCLGQACAKLYTLFRTERSKTIPCPAAHPYIGDMRLVNQGWPF